AEDARQRALEDLAGLGERHLEEAVDDERGLVAHDRAGLAELEERHAAGDAGVDEALLLAARHGADGAGDGLGEERVELGDSVALEKAGDRDARADAVAQAGLEEGLDEAALGEVVRGVDELVARGVDEDVGERLLRGEVEPRGHATEVA